MGALVAAIMVAAVAVVSAASLGDRVRLLAVERESAATTTEQERKRIAAEIHEGPLQLLAIVQKRLEMSDDHDAAHLVRDASVQLRSLCLDLRIHQPLLEQAGTGDALAWLVGEGDLLGQVTLLRREAGNRPPATVEVAVYRIVQEALVNARRHASPPIRVVYAVSREGDVAATVDDSGPGLSVEALAAATRGGRLGFPTMRQRAREVGGTLIFDRAPSGGLRVDFRWTPE